MTEEERNVTPSEFIELIQRAIYWTHYNGFTKEELQQIYAGATTLGSACEQSFDELEADDMQERQANEWHTSDTESRQYHRDCRRLRK